MKKIIGKLTAVLCYSLVLCYFLKTEWMQLFDLRMAGLVILGTGILCLPYFSEKQSAAAWQDIFGKNAMMAGSLEAFFMLFSSMNSSELMREGLLREMAMDLRPILYGYVLYIIFYREDAERSRQKKQPGIQAGFGTEPEQPEAAEVIREKQEETGEIYTQKEKIWENDKLTRREKEVAALAARGLSNREIAEELYISETTVKKHMSNIFEKLGIDTRDKLK